ncbi:spermatogenesis-associated protein 7 isoform X1 [Ahaetulla prasina]|uniref:spermatogenesis-associated protein 7 isoform X1 n=1 Tax=Ahaetulla prasina TaxID=499056 RepID=UPI0026491F03|nr:spermatogenesis-associated protein 7 isoform X1 [Ahaetulla prasina]
MRIPNHSLMGPFRGHMSIKSSPFSLSSSCKLSSQYIIQDHMAMHYRKLLTAKAAVDSSAPKSLNTSIKYRDQQKREKLIKAVEKFKKEVALIHSMPSGHSRGVSTKNLNQLPNHLNLVPRARSSPLRKEEQKPSKLSKKMYASLQPSILKEEDIQGPVLSRTYRNALQPCALSLSLSPGKLCQGPKKKSTSGDLLDTHADWFTETKQPFTPKLLKTTSKSFLSKYRYYNHPCRKKSLSSHTQSHKRSRNVCRSMDNEWLRAHADDPPCHPLKKHSGNSTTVQTLLRAKNEELKYLQLLQEITNYILLRSCYWKKSLGDIIRMHIINRCDLDEVKIQRIFQTLEEDLNIYTQLPDSSELHCLETQE